MYPLQQPSNDERDLAELNPFWPKVAAALTALGGLCAVLGSLQTWMTVEIESEMAALPVVNAILGVACIVTATRLVSARRWAAITAVAVAALLTVLSGIWCVFALTNGLIAVFIIVAPPMCLAGTGVAAASISSCDRADRARARLGAQGLDLGI